MKAHDGKSREVTPHGGEAMKKITYIPLDGCILANLMCKGGQHLARGDREN
jgi:hypothetical protein